MTDNFPDPTAPRYDDDSPGTGRPYGIGDGTAPSSGSSAARPQDPGQSQADAAPQRYGAEQDRDTTPHTGLGMGTGTNMDMAAARGVTWPPQTGDTTADGSSETGDGRTDPGHTPGYDAPPAYGAPADPRPTHGRPMDAPMDAQPVYGTPMGAQPVYGTPAGNQPIYGEPADTPSTYGAPMDPQPLHGGPVYGYGQGQPYSGQPYSEQSAYGQPYSEQPVYGQPPYGTPASGYGYGYGYGYGDVGRSPKTKVAAGLLQLFLGGFGVGRFYLGHMKIGFIQAGLSLLGWFLVVGGFFGTMASFVLDGSIDEAGMAGGVSTAELGFIVVVVEGAWALVDAIRMFLGSVHDSEGRPLG